MTRSSSPVGQPTRGTTNTNRLRRVDRWIVTQNAVRRAASPLLVDLGFGASGVTAFELATRVRKAHPSAEVLGLEIAPERVARARQQLEEVRAGRTSFAPDLPVTFARGGFEVPAMRRPHVIRAFNVLRQYDEQDVRDAWGRMAARLDPQGVLVEGTCDEIGRVSSWVAIGADGIPRTLTASLRLTDLEAPSIVAERLPKALIHHNVPGEPIHDFLVALDQAWTRQAPLSSFGPVQRWSAAVQTLHAAGWPVRTPRARVKLGEISVDWDAVAPQEAG